MNVLLLGFSKITFKPNYVHGSGWEASFFFLKGNPQSHKRGSQIEESMHINPWHPISWSSYLWNKSIAFFFKLSNKRMNACMYIATKLWSCRICENTGILCVCSKLASPASKPTCLRNILCNQVYCFARCSVLCLYSCTLFVMCHLFAGLFIVFHGQYIELAPTWRNWILLLRSNHLLFLHVQLVVN